MVPPEQHAWKPIDRRGHCTVVIVASSVAGEKLEVLIVDELSEFPGGCCCDTLENEEISLLTVDVVDVVLVVYSPC